MGDREGVTEGGWCRGDSGDTAGERGSGERELVTDGGCCRGERGDTEGDRGRGDRDRVTEGGRGKKDDTTVGGACNGLHTYVTGGD